MRPVAYLSQQQATGSGALARIHLVVASLRQIREAFDGRAHLFDAPAVITPFNDDFIADLGLVDIDTGHRNDFAKEVAVDGAGGVADALRVRKKMVCMRQ